MTYLWWWFDAYFQGKKMRYISRSLLCFVILFLAHAFSQGQAIWVPVEVGQDSFPFKEFRGEVLLPNAIYSLKGSWDSTYRNDAGVFPEGMFVIQAGRQMTFWKEEYAALVSADSLGGLIGRDVKTGQWMMGIDGNGNRVFEPQEVSPMRKNGLHLVHWQLKTPEGKAFWDLDLEIQYTPGRDADLRIRTLTLGKVLLPLEDTLLREVISLGVLEPCFYLPDSASSGRFKTTRYVLGEPFPFGRYYYMLDQLDIPNKRIRLTTFPPDHRPFGYKEGYFLNMDSLQTLLQNYYQNLKNVPVVAWNPDRYKLFYFWGTWCGPCMEKLPQSTALYHKLTASSKLDMIPVALLSPQENIDSFHSMLKERKIPFVNILQGKEGVGWIIDLFKNYSFPNYILIGPDGKVIFREGDIEEVYRHLKKRKLLEGQ